jgi:hypothetical protein
MPEPAASAKPARTDASKTEPPRTGMAALARRATGSN